MRKQRKTRGLWSEGCGGSNTVSKEIVTVKGYQMIISVTEKNEAGNRRGLILDRVPDKGFLRKGHLSK